MDDRNEDRPALPADTTPEGTPDSSGERSAARFDPQRRRILAGSAAGGLALVSHRLGARAAPATGELPPPHSSGIDHIVVVMMENRSFDHFLGWVPGADGVQGGLSFTDAEGAVATTHPLAPDYQGCAYADPAHGYKSGRTQANGDAMDGFLLTQPTGDHFPIGYYGSADLPFYAGCAANWTICDRYFSGILASTWPNRIYMHAGQTDRISNDAAPCKLPTIWDRLADAGIAGRYYFTDLPFTAIWGPKLLQYSERVTGFYEAAAAGTLPAVSFVDPRFGGEGDGSSADDHPLADIRAGQAFLNQIYEALIRSPQWSRTLMIINYDEWGGFFDHVPPPYAAVSESDLAAGNDGRLGIRVPCVLIGPRARRGAVSQLQLDPNSILNFICWRFGLPPLGVRADSTNLAFALDFDGPRRLHAPLFAVPPAPVSRSCQLSDAPAARRAAVAGRRDEHERELATLLKMARAAGFSA